MCKFNCVRTYQFWVLTEIDHLACHWILSLISNVFAGWCAKIVLNNCVIKAVNFTVACIQHRLRNTVCCWFWTEIKGGTKGQGFPVGSTSKCSPRSYFCCNCGLILKDWAFPVLRVFVSVWGLLTLEIIELVLNNKMAGQVYSFFLPTSFLLFFFFVCRT